MPGFWFPTKKQLVSTYKRIATAKVEDGSAKKLSKAPRGLQEPMKRNVGIADLKGREDLFYRSGEIIIKNTQGTKVSWYDCGPAPLF